MIKSNHKVLIGIVVYSILILYVAIAYGGTRRNIEVYDGGKKTESGRVIYEHYTLLDPGECDDTGCLIGEIPMEQYNGAEWLYQFMDTNKDGACDVIRIWKPLVDPTYGTYYTIYKTIPCKTLDIDKRSTS